MVGHGLENDLRAMRLVHTNTVDTTVLYPHFRGLPTKNSLRYLTCKYLNRKIQSGEGISGGGHDSAEDAIAALELAVLKEKNGPGFGSPHKVGHHLFQVLSKRGSGADMCLHWGARVCKTALARRNACDALREQCRHCVQGVS